jgi:hypothetical protein
MGKLESVDQTDRLRSHGYRRLGEGVEICADIVPDQHPPSNLTGPEAGLRVIPGSRDDHRWETSLLTDTRRRENVLAVRDLGRVAVLHWEEGCDLFQMPGAIGGLPPLLIDDQKVAEIDREAARPRVDGGAAQFSPGLGSANLRAGDSLDSERPNVGIHR